MTMAMTITKKLIILIVSVIAISVIAVNMRIKMIKIFMITTNTIF